MRVKDSRLQLRSLGPPLSGPCRTQCPSATELIETAAHRRVDRRRDDLCEDGLRKRALELLAAVTGIALQRLDALTRDDRNHENRSY